MNLVCTASLVIVNSKTNAKHYTEKCQENASCKEKKTCPKDFQEIVKEIWRFGDECGYNHNNVSETSKNNELKHKVLFLKQQWLTYIRGL